MDDGIDASKLIEELAQELGRKDLTIKILELRLREALAKFTQETEAKTPPEE